MRGSLLVLLLASSAIGTTSVPAPPAPAIPLVQSGRGWILEARVNDHLTGRFLLDTGATSCAITPLLAGQLGLFPPARHVVVDTAAGPVRSGVVRLQSVTVGAHRAERLQAIVLDDFADGLDGVIGLNFLDRFVYAIDPRRGLLELR